MATGTKVTASVADLSAVLRPALLRLTRLVRHQRADMSVTLTQLSAMHTLSAHGPMSARELAAQEKVQPPSMTKVLANLEERDLVVRNPHPSDGRQVVLQITDAGRTLLEQERLRRDAWLSTRLAALDHDERVLLERVVPILEKLAQQ